MPRRSIRLNLSFVLKSCSGSSGFFFPICILLLATSCADYESGYQHGYNNSVARNWLVIGRELYKDGYTEGQMQAFQDDWYAENADDLQHNYPRVVFITETWLTDEHPNSLFLCNDKYSIYRKDRALMKGGGVAILVRNDMDSFVLDSPLFKELELLT